jgi:hypothetical protein
MGTQLLIETTRHAAILAVVLGIATGVKALASVLRTWIEQAARTRRLARALEDSTPNQRPHIIMACSHLESTPASDPGGDMADEALPLPPAPIPRDKRGHLRHRD